MILGTHFFVRQQVVVGIYRTVEEDRGGLALEPHLGAKLLTSGGIRTPLPTRVDAPWSCVLFEGVARLYVRRSSATWRCVHDKLAG